jgi:ubiquinone/menaquinone biosynthesis C-methylase UbiE
MNSVWLFNLGADLYAWFTAQAAWRASCARMAERLAPIDPATVLDLGCGPGVSTFELVRRLPGATLIGVDVAPRMLAQARRRQRDLRVTWLRADAAGLPLRANSVDACTGHSFLYLVHHRRAVLREIRRVLRPGGRVVFMEPHAQPATTSTVLRLSRDPRHLVSVSLWRPFSRLHGRFSKSSLAQTLGSAGFQDVSVEETLGGLGLLASATAP